MFKGLLQPSNLRVIRCITTVVMATAKNEAVPYLNGSEQYEFVKSDLKEVHRNTKIDWIIVDTFRPLFFKFNSSRFR